MHGSISTQGNVILQRSNTADIIDMTLSKRSQTQKNTDCKRPLTWFCKTEETVVVGIRGLPL